MQKSSQVIVGQNYLIFGQMLRENIQSEQNWSRKHNGYDLISRDKLDDHDPNSTPMFVFDWKLQFTTTDSYRRRSSESSYPQFSRKNDISR